MKILNKILILGAAPVAMAFSAPAHAAVINGTLTLTLNGTLRVAGKGYTQIDCSAHAYLIPTTAGAVTLGAAPILQWLRSGDQSSDGHASFQYSSAGSSVKGTAPTSATPGSVTGFVCKVVVPYTFTNAAATGQSIAVAYKVTASDPGANIFNPATFQTTWTPPSYPGGKSQQVMQIAVPPTSPGVINLSAAPNL